jgi:hypothetical protein
MPFTFSHPAAILPAVLLPKRYYSFTGLIAGSVVPDFEYFIRLSIHGDYGHSIPGIFWFNLPLAIILAWIYHDIVRDPFINNLPKFFQSRLSQYQSLHWSLYFKRNWAIIIVSVILGTCSHLLWDSFTHETGFFAGLIPGLMAEIMGFGHPIPVYELVQHGSTILGAFIVFIYINQLPKNPVSTETKNRGYWWVAIMITSVVIGIRALAGFDEEFINSIIIAGMSGTLLALIVTPVLLKQFAKINRNGSDFFDTVAK